MFKKNKFSDVSLEQMPKKYDLELKLNFELSVVNKEYGDIAKVASVTLNDAGSLNTDSKNKNIKKEISNLLEELYDKLEKHIEKSPYLTNGEREVKERDKNNY